MLNSPPPPREPPPAGRVSQRRLPLAPPLRETVATVRQRALLVRGSAGALWGILAFGGTLLVASWIDLALDLPGSLRAAAWGLGALVMLVLAQRLLSRAWRGATPFQIARNLDAVVGTGGEIASGYDLVQHINRRKASSATYGLSQLAVQRAAHLASIVPTGSAVPFRPLLQAYAFAALAVLVIVALSLSAPRLARTQWARFTDPFGDHPAWSPYEFEIEPGDSIVPYGGELEIRATVTGPATTQLELVLVPGADERSTGLAETAPLDVLPMFPRANGQWSVTLSNITRAQDYFVRVRRARSSAGQIQVRTVPEIHDVLIELTPPAYTGLPAFKGQLPTKGLEVLRDSKLRVEMSSNRPLARGHARLQAGDDVVRGDLSPLGDAQRVAGELTITTAGLLELQVQDVEGQMSERPRTVNIKLLEDTRPVVRITQPRALSYATPTVTLPVVVAAEDDYGVSRLQLFRSLNTSRSLPQGAELDARRPRRMNWNSALPLSAYGLEPGDEIKMFAVAEDNDPHGPSAPVGKLTESAVVTVKIISQAEFDQMHRERVGMQMLSSKYDQARRRMEKIAAQIEQAQKSLEDGATAEGARERLQQLARQLVEEAQAIRKLTEQKLPLDLDKELNPQLTEMAEQLEEMAAELGELAEKQDLTPQQAGESLKEQLKQLREEQEERREKIEEPLEWLRSALAMKQSEAAFQQLVQQQRDLADRMTALKDLAEADDPAAKAQMRQHEEEQRRLREDLSRLLTKIREDAARLPEDERLEDLRKTAREFVRAVQDSDAGGLMEDAEFQLGKFEGAQAHQSAEAAAKALESFLSQCQSMGDAAGSCLPKFSPGSSLSEALQKTLGQLSPGNRAGGLGSGQGGVGGYSSRSSTMDNVGLYGGLPLLDGSGELNANAASGGDGLLGDGTGTGSRDGAAAAGFEGRQAQPAMGGAEWGVPLRYRRQAGKYLQQLADELDQ